MSRLNAGLRTSNSLSRNSKPRTKPAKRNRGALPAHLPRIELIVDVEDKACPCCGGTTHVIGEDVAEMLDYAPAQVRVKVIRRPRRGCRACEGAVVQAPAPDRPIDGGMATEALLAHILISKYGDSLPLYRQAQIFARQGVMLDRSTLCDWVGRACWWLAPLHELMMTTVLASPKIFADDTTLPVLDPGRGKTKTGRLWCYAVDNRPWCGPGHPAAVYIYSDDRKGVHPAEHLKGYSGLIQVDGYAGFARLVTDPAGDVPQLAFCWAHARRKLYDVFIATKSAIAEEAVKRIAELYAIESGVRDDPAEERQRVRDHKSRPLVEAMHVWLTEQLGRIPGASTLAKAIRYALHHWSGLVVFLEDGRLELGRVENRRGCISLPVGCWRRFRAAPSVRTDMTPSPVPARQTGHADFPHPAFSRSVRPLLSAGRRVAVEPGRGRVSRRDTRLGFGGTQRLVVPCGASTSGGFVAQCMLEQAHRSP